MIRRVLQSVLSIALAPLLAAQQVASSSAASPETTKPIVLVKGKEVRLMLLEDVSSASATKGQSVRMAVMEDVTDEKGLVVIPKGTPAKDIVDGVVRAVPGEKDGCVSLRPVSVNPPNSAPIPLGNYHYVETDGLGAALAPLLPFVLIAELVAMPFHRNHEAGIDENLRVCEWQQSQTPRTIRVQPSAIAEIRAASPGIAFGSLCPNGATYPFP